MKKFLLLIIILLLGGCSKQLDYEHYYQNSNVEVIQGEVKVETELVMEDSIIPFNFNYVFASNEQGSKIDLDNGTINTHLIYKDGVAFVQDEQNLYSYDDYEYLYASLLPFDIKNSDIKQSMRKDNTVEIVLKDEAIERLLGIKDAKIQENLFVYQLANDQIISEEVKIVYDYDQEQHQYHKMANYKYDDTDLDLSVFDYMQQDYKNFDGVCSFDNGTSSIEDEIVIKDDQLQKLHMIQRSHLDVVSSVTDNVDEYIQQLQKLYDDVTGVEAKIYLESDVVVSELWIDGQKIDEKAQALLDIQTNGDELIKKLHSKGYKCVAK